MLNQDKIKLMTGIAMFEKREGKRIAPAVRYFQSDYISSKMLRSLLSYTFCYLLAAMLWVLYRFDALLNEMKLEVMTPLVRNAFFLYLVGLALYLIITYVVYRQRYEYARRGIKVYLAKLRRLEKRYEFQSRSKELTKEGQPL